ncbi:MAG TPA: VOC family protein [Planctomycetota bacterium]|nr:VOC family protein [Planctomycetota bacterium]HRV81215.1 VOC family protein [Planctomycetota bacterium]
MTPKITRITPCLWFAGNAEEAVERYVALFPGSKIKDVQRSPPGNLLPEGTVMTMQFTLVGVDFMVINGTNQFVLNEAFSMSVACPDQAEIDRLWDALLEDGGKTKACGWLEDRFGLSWQIVPESLTRLLNSGDAAARARTMAALFGMIKLDIAGLEKAHAGA